MNLFACVHSVFESVADLLARLSEHIGNILGREGVRVDVDVPAGFAFLRAASLVDDTQVEGVHR